MNRKPAATQTPPVQQVPLDPKWNCQIQGLDTDGKPVQFDGQLTVGKKFLLVCEGPPVTMNRDKLAIENPKEVKYALHLLETHSLTDTKAELVTTAWMSGDLKLKASVLTDGVHHLPLGEIDLQVASVITPENNPEKKPAPPWGAIQLAWPLYVWVFIVALLGAFAVLCTLIVRKSLLRRRFLAELKTHETALSPYDQFNKDLRRLTRDVPSDQAQWTLTRSQTFFVELNQSFRWYLARVLEFPVMTSRPSQVASAIQDFDKDLYKSMRRDLVLGLNEIGKAISAKSAPSLADVQQLSDLCRGLADRVQAAVASKSRKEKR